MAIPTSIRQRGFTRWYEHELLLGHAHLVLLVLAALAAGVDATGTRQRLHGIAAPLAIPAAEISAWVSGFEYLQLMRLGVQAGGAAPAQANRIELASLNEIDRRVLRETLRVARRLQQRLELDYLR